MMSEKCNKSGKMDKKKYLSQEDVWIEEWIRFETITEDSFKDMRI